MKTIGGAGEDSYHSKLTQDQVDELREIVRFRKSVAASLADKVLAKHFGVGYHQIRKITARKSWKK